MRLRRPARRLRRLLLVTVGATVLAVAPAFAHDPPDDPPEPAPSADLALVLTGAPDVVQGGATATFTLTVTNAGPRHARRVKAAIALTGGTIAGVSGAGWTCDAGTALAICSIRKIRRGSTSSLAVTTVAPGGFQRIGAGAFVTARTPDPDPADNSATAFVSVNNPPSVADDHATTPEGVPVDIPVLANDVEPDGDQLTFSAVGTPSHGTVACADFGCVYTPEAGATGIDAFTYTVSDGRGGSATATVTVTVTPAVVVTDTPPDHPAPPPPGNSGNGDAGVVVSGPPTVHPGGTGSYVAVVSNGCVVTARDVMVQLTLPAGTTLISAPSGATRRGRVVTVRIGSLTRRTPRGVGVRVRFGRNGGSLRTLVVAVSSSNSRLTGDGVVITVR